MYNEFIRKIENYSHVGVLSHIRPDGDCIGSQVALCKWLEKKGLTATAFNDDEVSEDLQWLLNNVPLKQPTDEMLSACDLFIMVDGNALHRFGMFADWVEGKSVPLWMIDHHPDPEDSFDLSISVEHASSTCELIYNLIKHDNIDMIDREMAKALYTGIITDTGSLQFESVTPESVEIVADLLRRGKFTPNEVIDLIYSNKTLPQLRLLSMALETIQLFENNQIAVISVNGEMIKETGTSYSDCEGFVNYPLSISGVKAAIFFKDFYDEGIRISLRSRSDIDVNAWAREFGGGGHKKAAGAWHKGPLDQAIREFVKIGAKQINEIYSST
jgi:bifunctional oligoribonuclease and PAP phosphatase NrnA